MTKGKKAWSWSSYLEEEKAIAAPAKIFKEVCYLEDLTDCLFEVA